jgi:hypothetical protein
VLALAHEKRRANKPLLYADFYTEFGPYMEVSGEESLGFPKIKGLEWADLNYKLVEAITALLSRGALDVVPATVEE